MTTASEDATVSFMMATNDGDRWVQLDAEECDAGGKVLALYESCSLPRVVIDGQHSQEKSAAIRRQYSAWN